MNNEKKIVAVGLVVLLVAGFLVFNTGSDVSETDLVVEDDSALAGEAIRFGSNKVNTAKADSSGINMISVLDTITCPESIDLEQAGGYSPTDSFGSKYADHEWVLTSSPDVYLGEVYLYDNDYGSGWIGCYYTMRENAYVNTSSDGDNDDFPDTNDYDFRLTISYGDGSGDYTLEEVENCRYKSSSGYEIVCDRK